MSFSRWTVQLVTLPKGLCSAMGRNYGYTSIWGTSEESHWVKKTNPKCCIRYDSTYVTHRKWQNSTDGEQISVPRAGDEGGGAGEYGRHRDPVMLKGSSILTVLIVQEPTHVIKLYLTKYTQQISTHKTGEIWRRLVDCINILVLTMQYSFENVIIGESGQSSQGVCYVLQLHTNLQFKKIFN